MDADEYVKARLEPQIAWYDKKSKFYKRQFHTCRLAELIFAALIPIISAEAADAPALRWVVSMLGILIAIAAGWMGLFQSQEHWIKYRTTAESLKKEKYLFSTKVDPYKLEDPLEMLVTRCETLISQENTNWAQYMMRPSKEVDKK